MGRPSSLLGHGAGWADYSLAGTPESEDRSARTSDRISDNLGFGADRDGHLRAVDHLQRNGVGMLHGIDTVCNLSAPFERGRATPRLLQPGVSGLTRRACRR